MAWPTDNLDHGLLITSSSQLPGWKEEQVFHFSHRKGHPECFTFLVSLETCGLQDLHAPGKWTGVVKESVGPKRQAAHIPVPLLAFPEAVVSGQSHFYSVPQFPLQPPLF